VLGAKGRQVLARQRDGRGRAQGRQRYLPAFGGLHRIGRAQHEMVRDGAQRGQMLDRLMRRSVLAEADRIVRHHEDHALPISAARRIDGRQ
jgi:hypothetical protein